MSKEADRLEGVGDEESKEEGKERRPDAPEATTLSPRRGDAPQGEEPIVSLQPHK